ncbi:hypothetical protein [Trichormus variabilis]|uniref:Uncharacterized protein n=1 Tax=Trichormus variabilis SAG 1403-4b TaxID=447716 RepID=A0A3S1C2I2_ANAVA|nr:hypothetical protein [Trichormus variabilis]MBD2625796.1 hypothetical protein [Trichormus variabilis FACHB-164]RUS99082.1 hypothetical protein DSM107003_11010 [Trichormus variabilis SAG 1403-4b]
MSSGSSGPYQSKIFKFFNQHSQRLTKKWENSFRNLQVATKWSVEALLYPLYQMFQPDELAGKQLPPETPPPADAPIQHVLELVKNLPSAAASDSQSSQKVKPLTFLGDTLREAATRLGWLKNSRLPQSLQPEKTLQHHIPKVLGIAAQLENRHLVLVSNDNRILDVLTIQQQEKLTNKINSEVAEYWHFCKLAEIQQQQKLLPEINRILSKLTTNDTPNITDLAETKIPVNIEDYPGKFLALMDTVIAKLESKALVPVQQRSQKIIQVAKTQFDIFIYGREQLEARGRIAINPGDLENQTLNISELITAAINYFFGERNLQNIDSQPTPEKLPGKSSNQIDQNNQLSEADLNNFNKLNNWLTWNDLFAKIELDPKNASLNSDTNLVTENTHYELSSKSRRDLFRSKKFAKVASSSQVEIEIKAEKDQYEAQPDWIETTATFLGYEKHPLEQILAWLDHVMLWIEMIFMNMIYFFKGLLQVR